MMKKTVLVLTLAVVLSALLSGCNPSIQSSQAVNTIEPIVSVLPGDVFTINDVSSIVNYAPILDENIEKTDNSATITYRSEPVGMGDIVKVTVEQYSDSITKDEVKASYDKAKSLRSTAVSLQGIGEDAYIAYPSVHIYKNGYHITVTAGSGNDDAQMQLLTNIANIVNQKLTQLIGS